MSTWYQDHAKELKDRPWMGRPIWELKNIVRALSMMSGLNTADQNQRLTEVKRELKLRGVVVAMLVLLAVDIPLQTAGAPSAPVCVEFCTPIAAPLASPTIPNTGGN